MTYSRYEPANGPNYAGLGSPVVRAPKVKAAIGPDTEGLSPGFHKQSNGLLMYVPDMAVIDRKPKAAVDIHCDDTRPAGFYDVTNDVGSDFIRHWHDGLWFQTGVSPTDEPNYRIIRSAWLGELAINPEEACTVLRPRPDLDAVYPPHQPLEGDPPPVYDEPEGDELGDDEDPIDLRIDATRPVGFYECDCEHGKQWVRYWTGTMWYATGKSPRDTFDTALIRETVEGFNGRAAGQDDPVVRARPDLDAMVQA